jgi:hypothetical protein
MNITVAAASSSEDNHVGSAHRPSTPTNQPTKPASTNAPARPVQVKYRHTTCQGCIDQQPNQMAHVSIGGCLHSAYSN